MIRRKQCLALLLGAALLPSFASAQDEGRLERFQRRLDEFQFEQLRTPPELPPDQRWFVDYGLYLSAGFAWIDDFRGDAHRFAQYEATGYALASYEQTHTFFVRSSVRFRDFSTGEDFDGDGDEWIGPRVDRAFYTFDYSGLLAAQQGTQSSRTFTVTAGRQFVRWANGVALATDLDALSARVRIDNVYLDAVVGRTRSEVDDFDTSRPDWDSDTIRTFYGAMFSLDITPEHRPFAYFLKQEDGNNDTTATVNGVSTEFGYESFYVGLGISGNLNDSLLYAVEGVIEGGRTFSSPVDNAGNLVGQTTDPIQAWALDLRLDYVPDLDTRPRLGVELLVASGDDDRLSATNTFAGNAPNTTDNGFNAFGLLNTGLAYNGSVSNLVMLRAGASALPMPYDPMFRRFQLGGDVLLFHKYRSDGGIDEPSNDGGYIGTEVDAYINWQITSDVSTLLRYGVFFPGEAIETDDEIRHFFFLQVTYGF